MNKIVEIKEDTILPLATLHEMDLDYRNMYGGNGIRLHREAGMA